MSLYSLMMGFMFGFLISKYEDPWNNSNQIAKVCIMSLFWPLTLLGMGAMYIWKKITK